MTDRLEWDVLGGLRYRVGCAGYPQVVVIAGLEGLEVSSQTHTPVFLLGAEIAAGFERRETVFLKRLMAGKRGVPAAVAGRFITRYAPGETIFTEGDTGDQMFCVLKGEVALWKGDRIIATVTAGQYFGVVSFLLATPRIAAAIAQDNVELVLITRQNIADLMSESPEFILAMLKETAMRLRETNKLLE